MYLQENLQAVFAMLGVTFVPHWRFFIHCFLMSSLNPVCAICQVSLIGIYPFCTFSPAHPRVICNTFILPFPDFSSYRECYGSEQTFFTRKHFLPCTPSPYFGTFGIHMRGVTLHPGSSSMPALIELFPSS